MFPRKIVFTALAVYLLVLGSVILTRGTSARSPDSTRSAAPLTTIPGLPYRGVGMQIQRVDWIDKYEKSIDEIADLGADTVLLVVDSRQENALKLQALGSVHGQQLWSLDRALTPARYRLHCYATVREAALHAVTHRTATNKDRQC